MVSSREGAPSSDLEGELVPVGDLHDYVKAALIKSEENNEENWLYCESEAKAAVAHGMKQSFKSRFEDCLKRLSEGLSKPKGRKKYIKVLVSINGQTYKEIIMRASPNISTFKN